MDQAMVRHRWLVEIAIEPFAPSQRNWASFIATAKLHQDSTFQLVTENAAESDRNPAVIKAIVEAPTPEAAIHRAMSVVRDAGRRGDRDGLLHWEALRGSATRYE